jgi:hypothetical protein
MFAGYVYGSLKPKIYKTEITLRVATSPFFELYRPFLDLEFQLQQQQQQHKKDIAELFNREFELNLLSLDTLVQFVEKNNTINDFKNHLKEKNISDRSYFKEKFKPVINNENIFNGSLMITNDEKSDTYHIKANNDDCYVDIKLPKELEETKMSLFHFVSDYRTSIFISFIFFLIMAVNMPILFRIPEHKQRKKIFNYCILFLVLIFTFWYFANSPLSFPTFAKHDDQLFINLLRNLTEGCWLGIFNNLTLAKGPAFPLLLSTLYFFKIPIQIFYSLMAILTGIILYITCESYTRNPLIRGLVAVLVVFYPGLDFVRPLRDTYFYWMSILGILILLLNLKNFYLQYLHVSRSLHASTYVEYVLQFYC